MYLTISKLISKRYDFIYSDVLDEGIKSENSSYNAMLSYFILTKYMSYFKDMALFLNKKKKNKLNACIIFMNKMIIIVIVVLNFFWMFKII